MKKLLQWIGIGVVAIFAFAGIVGVVGAVVIATDTPQASHAEPMKETKPESKPETKDSRKKVQPVAAENVVEVDASDAMAAAQEYYDAASAGDFSYTYTYLGIDARNTYTEAEWTTINQALGSAGASYVVQDATAQADGTYQVDLIVEGTPRTTYFIMDGGEWYHLPTAEEYALYDSGLGVGSSASASASPTTVPGGTTTSSNEVEVTVEVEANAPVDVSITSFKDMGVPMISEQVQSETYTFTKNANADLSVDASDPNMDLSSDEAIHVAVYENGELVSEDFDSDWAMVSY